GAEVLGPVGAGESDADLLEGAVEDVLPVAGTVHPALHHLLRSGVAVGDVLAVGAPAVAGAGDALVGGGAVGAGVRHVPVRRHVRAVVLGGLGQLGVDGHRRATRLGALGVDQLHDPG